MAMRATQMVCQEMGVTVDGVHLHPMVISVRVEIRETPSMSNRDSREWMDNRVECVLA